MRAARITGLVVLAAVALALLALALLNWLVDAGRFRPQIEAAVQTATGRPLRIAGGVELDVLPFVGLAVRDASLGNPPGFSSPTLLHFDELVLGARLLPLLRGRFELTRVRLAGADLLLERSADGRANWQGLGDSTPGPADRSAGATRLRSLAGVELRDLRLRYVDAASGDAYELADLDADLAEWAPGQPLRFTASANWVDAARPAWPVTAAGRIEVGEAQSTLRDGSFTLLWRTRPEVAGLPVRLLAARVVAGTGNGASFSGAPLEVRLGGDGDRIDVADWRVTQAAGGVALQARVALAVRSVRALLDASGIGAPYTTDPRVVGPLRGTAVLRQGADGLVIEPIELALDDTTLRGRIRRGATAPLEIELDGDRMEIGRYLEPADAPTPPFRFPTAALRALQARATLTLERATLGDAQLEGVTLRLVLDEQGVRRGTPEAAAAAPPATAP